MNVVVTGSTRGIGFGLCVEFLSLGHNVFINSRSKEDVEKTIAILKKQFPNQRIFGGYCDVSDYEEMLEMTKYIKTRFKKVDIWINNAGINQINTSILEHNPIVMNKVIDVNIKSVVNGTKIASNIMKINGGFIYNLEGFGYDGSTTKNRSIYGMTNCAINYFTMSAAKEFDNTKIKIGLLNPGIVLTDLMLKSIPTNKNREKYLKVYNILGDTVQEVTKFLVEKIIKNQMNGKKIIWLTKRKVYFRFFSSILIKRKLKGLE